MDASFAIKAGFDLACSLAGKCPQNDFEGFAVGSYGNAMAKRYLLNYSRKLWGLPCDTLSPDIAGERLRKMNLLTILKNMVRKNAAGKSHYEGEFFYPNHGIGGLIDALVNSIGADNLRLQCKVTALIHDDSRINGVEINGQDVVSASQIVSTLPVADMIGMMRPEPPVEVMDAVNSLKFRHIRLAVFSVLKKSVNSAATMYFPDERYCFTRVYEPKNRCITMAPENQTSLAVEVPCFDGDWAWVADSDVFLARIQDQIVTAGLVRRDEIAGGTDERVVKAYPVLEKDYRKLSATASDYLSRFQNLQLSGRNGLFRYLWIHNLFREGKTIADRLTVTA
jgi:protoporphyrinogen oxidase